MSTPARCPICERWLELRCSVHGEMDSVLENIEAERDEARELLAREAASTREEMKALSENVTNVASNLQAENDNLRSSLREQLTDVGGLENEIAQLKAAHAAALDHIDAAYAIANSLESVKRASLAFGRIRSNLRCAREALEET